jgi:uncharacterized protein (DUF983 family)
MSKTQAWANGASEHATARTDVALVWSFLGRCPRCGKGRMLVPAVLSAIGLSSMVKPSLELRRADQLAAAW